MTKAAVWTKAQSLVLLLMGRSTMSSFRISYSLSLDLFLKYDHLSTKVSSIFSAVYIDPSNDVSKDFYSGIIAEPPKTMNKHRYLVGTYVLLFF